MISLKKIRQLLWRHLHFVGPGLVSSVAYIDPGNWATDLQAGADYGYKLLFVVLLAGLAAVVLQLLSVRLGAVTSSSLPLQTRKLFLRLEAKYPKWRIPLHIGLWSLYILAEIAIIGTDLAELIGSAIALNLLFPRLPLYAGVLVTAADVLIVLLFFRSQNGRQGMLLFEIVIVSLVLAVFVSFMILLKMVGPEWKEVFFGLVPSHTLVEPGALYVGVGIIGATVMPHALFLGSSLASVDRLDMLPIPPNQPSRKNFRMPNLFSFGRKRLSNSSNQEEAETANMELATLSPGRNRPELDKLQSEEMIGKNLEGSSGPSNSSQETLYKDYEVAQRQYEAEIKAFDRIAWVDVHLLHATIDTSMSLLGFALTINAAILTVAGAAFYYGTSGSDDATLQGAHSLIMDYIGNGAAVIFALALLCAGQSASITATLAGQVVSEGFINWRTSPFWRRLITRLIGVVPAAVIAAAVGPAGLNTMLVASQVLLSIVLPTVIFPLVYLCSKEDIMMVEGPEQDVPITQSATPSPQVVTPIIESQGEISPVISINQQLPTPLSPRLGIPSELDMVPPVLNLLGSDIQNDEMSSTPAGERPKKCYKSPKWVTILGYFLFAVVVVANVYVIVELGIGND